MTAAGLDGVILHSAGSRLLGGFYQAAGEGRMPAALFLHGIPGHEKNGDLIADLRDRGVHCMYFHYRGCWGSEGDYHLATQVDDAMVALEWLVAQPRVDPARVAVIGISLGGWVALMLAARAPRLRAVAALSPVIDAAAAPFKAALLAEYAQSLHGTTPEALSAEWNALTPIAAAAPDLAPMPILLVTADGDELFPPSHYAALPSLPRMTHVRFPRADHVFSDVRPGLRHVVCDWLLGQLA